jgi:Y-X(10)_GDL-associated radical SAM protein
VVVPPNRDSPAGKPSRFRTRADYQARIPVHVVWELTLACDLKCRHCGSRAGKKRVGELTTAECREIIEQLADLGTREITLIGGEAYLRSDWIDLVGAISSHGIYCALQTGARNLTSDRLKQAADAGLQGLGVSIDGLSELHDELRGVRGSYDRAIEALLCATDFGLRTSVNTQIGPQTIAQLRNIMFQLIRAKVTHWQLQLTVAMGNAVENDSLLLQPYQMLDLMPLLADLYHEGMDHGLLMVVGNNIGYFGPYEHFLRGYGDVYPHWSGCGAGNTVIGLESDGTVKGCPSLATSRYKVGNTRDTTLAELWKASPELRLASPRSVQDLWGFCRTCYYARVCRSGCTWTADSLLGRPGNNPYCHYRALTLQSEGLRERIAKKTSADPTPFATGEFEIIVEQQSGDDWVQQDPRQDRDEVDTVSILPIVTLSLPKGDAEDEHVSLTSDGAVPPELAICRACNCFIWDHESTCPHCRADVAAANAVYRRESAVRKDVMESIEKILAGPSDAAQER